MADGAVARSYQWGSRRMGLDDFLILVQSAVEDAADFGEDTTPNVFTITDASIKFRRRDGISLDMVPNKDFTGWTPRGKIGRKVVELSDANAAYREQVDEVARRRFTYFGLESWSVTARKVQRGIGVTATMHMSFPNANPRTSAELRIYRSLGKGWGLEQVVRALDTVRYGRDIRTMDKHCRLDGHALEQVFPDGPPMHWKQELAAAHPDATFPFVDPTPDMIYTAIKRPLAEEDALAWGEWPT